MFCEVRTISDDMLFNSSAYINALTNIKTIILKTENINVDVVMVSPISLSHLSSLESSIKLQYPIIRHYYKTIAKHKLMVVFRVGDLPAGVNGFRIAIIIPIVHRYNTLF